MYTMKTALLATIAFTAVSMCAHAQFQNVHISVAGDAAGKGIAISRGDECHVLTARHVVRNRLPIQVIGAERRSSPGTVDWSDAIADLALIAIEKPAAICARDFYMRVDDLEARLSANSSGYLRVRDEFGGEDDIWAQFTRRPDGIIDISPRDPGQKLQAGLSGSMFYVAERPAGILRKVSVDRNIGHVYAIDRIATLVGNTLPLVEPEEQRARLDPPLAADILRKSVNFMQTPEFCRNLLVLAEWVANPKDFKYDKKGRIGGNDSYEIKSWLFPGKVTTLAVSNDKRYRKASTLVGYAPESIDFEAHWQPAERTIDACVKSDSGREFFLEQRGVREPGEIDRESRWEMVRRKSSGVFHPVLNDVKIWLTFGVGIEIQVWSWD